MNNDSRDNRDNRDSADTPAPARILMVDDEESIRELVTTGLRFTGYEVAVAASGREALWSIADNPPDLIVLDVNLPDLDGFEVCRRVRDAGQIPVIFLTARDDVDDLRDGFARGGDDYMTKPFSLEELVFRVRAVLRRTLATPAALSRLGCGDVVLDEAAHQVWRGDREISLSPTEYRLLRYLLQNRDRVVSKDQIIDNVWTYDFFGESSVVETYVSYLRRKLDDREGRLIQTVRGFGYSMRTPAPVAKAS